MKVLAFASDETVSGRRIRRAHFQERSLFPVPAACVVANAVRETLATLFGSAVELRLFEPVVPSSKAWRAITADALLFRIGGARTDAAIVLRPESAVALASAAFGESAVTTRPLSSLESTVLARVVRALSPSIAAGCGGQGESVEPQRVDAIAEFATYFELQMESPVAARIGIALARDPSPQAQGALRIEDLFDVELEVRVVTEGALLRASELAGIEVGAVVPITETTGFTAVATIAGRPLARGESGVRGNRLALAVGLAPGTERE